jgi:hypothetical protein
LVLFRPKEQTDEEGLRELAKAQLAQVNNNAKRTRIIREKGRQNNNNLGFGITHGVYPTTDYVHKP